MGSLLTCTGASCWSDMARWYFVSVFKGGATGNHFPFSYSESGVLSLNFQLDRERPCFCSNTKPAAQPGQRGPTPAPNPSKAHRPAVYANYYGAQDAGFSADWCACISVCRELKKGILGA